MARDACITKRFLFPSLALVLLASMIISSTGQGNDSFIFSAWAAPAQASTFSSAVVRITDLAKIAPPSPDPSGITYLPFSNTLLVVDAEVEETAGGITHFQGVNVWELTLSGNVVRTTNISEKEPTLAPMTNEPAGIAWNPFNGHYYVSQDNATEVFDLNSGPDGLIGTSDDTWTQFDTLVHGNSDPEGITYDTWRNRIFVADGSNEKVFEYTTNGALINQFKVEDYGVEDPESVEFNSLSGTLFVLSSNRTSPVIVETTVTSVLLQTIDISAARIRTPAGLAYAPASDGSGMMRFYIVDRGIDNDTDPNIIDGKLYELTAPAPARLLKIFIPFVSKE